jgi:uncharacterized membrane protein
VTEAPARHDPLAAWRPTPRDLLGFALLGAALLVYPWAIDAALARLGTRPVAGVLLGLALLGGASPLQLGRVTERRIDFPHVPGFPGAFAVLLAAALATGDVRCLLLVPAAVYLWLALLAAASLRQPPSLIERAALFLQPRAPDFIRPYCRKVTALWCALFAATAVAIAWLVASGDDEARRAFSSWGLWLPVGVLSAVEYGVRKAWFRYYAGGALDRVWAALLPAENTERGRRSLAYIRDARARMRADGFTPPGEAARR